MKLLMEKCNGAKWWKIFTTPFTPVLHTRWKLLFVQLAKERWV